MNVVKSIKKRLSDIPSLPGVYFFKDARGRIIYIGKAVDLRARVKSYFIPLEAEYPVVFHGDERLINNVANARFNAPRELLTGFIKNSLYGIKASMLPEIKKIDYKTTETEIDALILESQLIKKHLPKYNVLLKDDKNYFYVVFTSEQFPKIFITHQPHKILNSLSSPRLLKSGGSRFKSNLDSRFRGNDTAHRSDLFYIGPYTDGQALKTTLRYLRKIFPYCTCKNQHKIPCLKSHLGLCLGICCLKQQSKSQNSVVILSPASRRTKNLGDPSRSPSSSEAKSFTTLAKGFTTLRMTEKDGASFRMTYKKNIKLIIDILSGKRKNILKKLEKEMETAAKNEDFENAAKLRDKISAMENIFQHKINDVGRHYGRPTSLEGAKSELDRIFDAKIKRIEFYDVSNISGQLATASMVVFDGEQINRSEYRKFKIKTVFGADDPAMMREVLARRLKHKEWKMPDLIIVDGGIAQFNAARAVLTRFCHSPDFRSRGNSEIAEPVPSAERGISLLAMTKSLDPRFHGDDRKKVKIASLAKNPDRLFFCLTSDVKQLALKNLSENTILLLQNLRDEAHRFAINYHRKLRSRKLLP